MTRDGNILFHNERDFAKRLLDVTSECGTDMHEPSIDAQLVGTTSHASHRGVYLEGSFDNAMGDHPDGGELVLSLVREREWDDEGSPTDIQTEHFNLASLVALARLGARALDGNVETLFGWAEKTVEALEAGTALGKQATRRSFAESLRIAVNGGKFSLGRSVAKSSDVR